MLYEYEVILMDDKIWYQNEQIEDEDEKKEQLQAAVAHLEADYQG